MIFIQLEWLYHFDRFKTWLGFDDLDPIFKALVLYVGYLLNQWVDFLETYIAVPLGQA